MPLTSIVLEYSSDPISGTGATVSNPTFDADITGWTETDVGAASMTPSHDTSVVRSGAGSLKLVNSAAGENDFMTATFTGVSGVKYEISAWQDASGTTATTAGLQAFGPGGVPGGITTSTAGTPGWVQHQVSLTLVSSGTVTVRLYGPQGTCYWDDVTVSIGWTPVPNGELRRVEWWMGTGAEGDDPEQGGATIVLVNKDRKWEPFYSSNVIDTHQRFRLTLNGVAEGVWFITNISVDYPGNTEWSVVTFECAGGFEALALDHLPSLDPPEAETYEDVVNFDEPWGFWELGESEGTKATARIVRSFRGKGKNRRKIKRRRGTNYQTREEAGGVSGPAGQYRNTPSLGQPGLILGDQGTAVEFVSSGSEYVRIPVEQDTFFARGLLSVECWVKITADQTMSLVSGPWDTPTASPMFGFQRQSPADTPVFFVNIGGGAANFVQGTTTLDVGETHHLVGTFDSTNIKLYVDGVLEATGGTPGSPIEGDADEFLYVGQSGNDSSYADAVMQKVAVYEYALSPERVLAHYQAGAERGFPQQTVGERISQIVTSGLWSETGIQTSGREVVPVMMHGQSRLDEVSEAMHAEGPRVLLFSNGAGDPVYLGHEWQATAAVYNTVQETFGQAEHGETPVDTLTPVYDHETYNVIQASCENQELAEVEDAVAVEKRGRRVLDDYTGLLLADHMDVVALANALLDTYKDPMRRVEEISVTGWDDQRMNAILTLDIGHLVRVNWSGETGARNGQVANILRKHKSLDNTERPHVLRCSYRLGRGFDALETGWHLGLPTRSELGQTTVLA